MKLVLILKYQPANLSVYRQRNLGKLPSELLYHFLSSLTIGALSLAAVSASR